ncbi:N-acetyl-gamma-glutamyl-phosphate reductase [Cysteiniphilum sp. QT6929]|uniref:N-acetyl-gamma-glutamyl-phosphate reductase n=1 Tax=Cysteiniphilum sp. QT6929 TaxID=2975055 RepID=UPI0024B363AF|nr:N-acetyl-gamma-glutamyl-phosphate reductase [Cysteiniphilum sp. QT6929]WHN66515.1 N-acetyl-gamma-glutamyl-phosphate reductase [Cysteiniphilum sp. QT6929]
MVEYNNKIKVGILGGAGYTAGELLRLLTHHPQVDIQSIHSASQGGELIAKTHHDFYLIDNKRVFDKEINYNVDVVFLCVGHGQAKEALKQHQFKADTKIIDLSQDHRDTQINPAFLYGLADIKQSEIAVASNIANPGCFATAIILALMPFGTYVNGDVHINAITGSTGAGVMPCETSHFSWRTNNMSVYKAFSHQHLAEIKQALKLSSNNQILFVPMRGNFSRGIFASIYFKSDLTEVRAQQILQAFYEQSAFVKVLDHEPGLKMVVNTNACLLSVKKHGEYLHVVSVIDNLIKGASGQALQNMNLMFGLPCELGLSLKASVF